MNHKMKRRKEKNAPINKQQHRVAEEDEKAEPQTVLRESHKIPFLLSCVFEMKRIFYSAFLPFIIFSEAKRRELRRRRRKEEEERKKIIFPLWNFFSCFSFLSLFKSMRKISSHHRFPSCDDVFFRLFFHVRSALSLSLSAALCMTRPNFWGGKNLLMMIAS